MKYASKGEVVTCTNDHVIGIFTRDVNRMEVFELDMLDWRDGIEHKNGEKLGNCRCGAAWNMGRDGGVRSGIMYVEGEWRE